MRRAALCILLALGWAHAGASPLDEALELALAHSATLAAAQAEAHAVGRQVDWSAKVRVGYAMQTTSETAAGLDAGVTLEIPLFSRKHKLAAAQARAKVSEAGDRTRRDLLDAVAKLEELEAKRIEGEEMSRFYRDRLEYFKKAEEQGRIEPDVLWGDAEKAKKAGHDAAQAQVKLAATLEETARKFGGDEWNRLSVLLTAHAKRSRP